MTYSIDNHRDIDGGSNCRAIFGVTFRAGERVVIALVERDIGQYFMPTNPDSCRWPGTRWGQLGPGEGAEARERTPYSEPRTERITIAKMEITTLSKAKSIRSCRYSRVWPSLEWGEAYQDQAFNADTTGFILASARENFVEIGGF
jgi:hypothetical protein